jgi:hypothetical protein
MVGNIAGREPEKMMLFSFKHMLVLAGLLAFPSWAVAAEPVRQIGIYVEPYYRAAETPSGRPLVAVHKRFDDLLSSNRREDILAARDLIAANPQLVTPMTMMVLAIRLYDVGLRDDAVFWFYAAKHRYAVMSEALDQQSLGQAEAAIRSFATLAGSIINGYAFCDLAKQSELHAKAVDWVERNPYEVMFMERMPARPGDRNANLRRAPANARDRLAQERAYFADSRNRDAFYAGRKAHDADAKFCWK